MADPWLVVFALVGATGLGGAATMLGFWFVRRAGYYEWRWWWQFAAACVVFVVGTIADARFWREVLP